MFLLLVFFMVATTFVNPNGLSVDLPGGQGDSSRTTKDMNIVIEVDGVIQDNGAAVEKSKLAAKINQVMKADNTKNVILEADRKVSHNLVVKVVDIARSQGIEGVAFAKAGEG
jgi:biopolymer transport protein ExbD